MQTDNDKDKEAQLEKLSKEMAKDLENLIKTSLTGCTVFGGFWMTLILLCCVVFLWRFM